MFLLYLTATQCRHIHQNCGRKEALTHDRGYETDSNVRRWVTNPHSVHRVLWAIRTPLVWIYLEVSWHSVCRRYTTHTYFFRKRSRWNPFSSLPVYKDITYNRFYVLSLPISSLCAVGQTIDELLQAVNLNPSPSTGEGLLLQHEMTHPRTGSISQIFE